MSRLDKVKELIEKRFNGSQAEFARATLRTYYPCHVGGLIVKNLSDSLNQTPCRLARLMNGITTRHYQMMIVKPRCTKKSSCQQAMGLQTI